MHDEAGVGRDTTVTTAPRPSVGSAPRVEGPGREQQIRGHGLAFDDLDLVRACAGTAPAAHCAMTVTEDGATDSARAAPEGQPETPQTVRRRRRYKPVVALLLVAGLVAAGWWWSHPSVYGGVGNQFGARPDRLVPVYITMLEEPDPSRVRVIDGEPRVRVFGEALAEVVLCDDAQIGILYGEEVGRGCFGPQLHGPQPSWDQVVLKVTPLQAGAVVVVDGIDLTYSTRLQRGTENAGIGGVVVFPDE